MPIKVIDWGNQPLGKLPDAQLAEKLGISTTTVRLKREKLKIKRYNILHDWDKQPLGEISDDELAAKLQVAVTTICSQRKKRNIPRYNPNSFVEPNVPDPYVPKLIGGSPLNW